MGIDMCFLCDLSIGYGYHFDDESNDRIVPKAALLRATGGGMIHMKN